MHFTFSEHPNELYNGQYEALDYLYNSEKPYTYFRNNNDVYLYYYPLNGESIGYWYLHDSEEYNYHNGGLMSDCRSYMCLFY